jgi:sec-independent protein translocase protein TatB
MFDIAFSELAVIGAVALVVLGPERLPKVARTAGHLFGRLQRYVATVKADLNREMDMSELSKVKQEVQEAARAFEQTAREHANSVESEARGLSQTFEKIGEPSAPPTVEGAASSPTTTPSSAPAAATTQADMLMAQESTFAEGTTASASPAIHATKPDQHRTAATSTANSGQGFLDFGIEPARPMRDRKAA